jgi:acyl-coenzyme A thioesterase PaaI-like protein
MIGGGLSAFVAAPNWIATADLTLHLVRAATGGTLEATARVLRAGRTTVVLEVELRDARDLVGVATMTFSVLPRREDNPVITFSAATPRTTLVLPGSGFRSPILDELGLDVVDAAAGVVDVPVTDYSRNSLGALQGGVVAIAIDVAAEQALRAACGSPVTVTDMQLTYLALVRGELRTSTEVVHATPAFGSALVDVLDVGGESRRTTTARVVATRARD